MKITNHRDDPSGKNKKGNTKKRGKRDIILLILTVPLLLLVAVASLLTFTVKWAFSFWANLTMDEIVYHLTSPLEGTGDDIMMKFYMYALAPALVIFVAVIVYLIIVRKIKKSWYGRCLGLVFLMFSGIAGFTFYQAWTTLKIGEYLKNQEITSVFIENNYVDPNSVQLAFPGRKRNLIFIYLESVETTFTDKKNGGDFEFDCIPELTKLAQKYEDFSGSSKELEGGHVEPGTTFTMGGMFGQTSGLPLQVGLKAKIMDKRGAMNEMYTQEHFFPGITTLGDILEAQGYHNVLFLGSEAVFGGRKLYFKEHGNYEIDDFDYAIKRNWLEDKEISWGYPDWRLFLQAEERLRELSEEDEPFNLTMLTVDTHFEDGIRCRYCLPEFPGNSYADVYACSSRQVNDFISWCQGQDWYENTTIILSGDHTTMDSNFCDDVAEDYPRKTYTCFINADAKTADPERRRNYTTLDIFPTTLAAMGVKIEGDRLGLGTDLFSSEDTLYEIYGDEMDAELNRRSLFLEQVSEFDPNTQAYKNAVIMYEAAYGDESGEDDSSMSDRSGTDDSSTAADESGIDDSSMSDGSGTDDNSTSADESGEDDSSIPTDGSGEDDNSVTADESGKDTVPDESYQRFLPGETEDIWNHIQGRDVIGSELIRDIMLDPWKKAVKGSEDGSVPAGQDT